MDGVIETIGDVRVRLELDDDPLEPYDDGGSPLLRFTDRRDYDTWVVEQVKCTSFEVPDNILAAARRWGPDGFVRYLRIFHGTTCSVAYRTDHYDYVTFDTAAWREAMALTDTHLDHYPELRGNLAKLDEWRHYCEGEVYGWVIERRVTWKRTDDETETMHTWEQVESCWGYYGHDDGVEMAKYHLAEYLKPPTTEGTERQ